MDKELDILRVVVLTFLLTAVITALIVVRSVTYNNIQQDAIKHGCAYYKVDETGKVSFIWKKGE